MASHFENAGDYAQYVDQYMVDQSSKLQAYKIYLDESFLAAVEQARQELRESMQQDFEMAVSQEGHRIELRKQQETTAWEKRTRQQFANDFKVQIALNSDNLEAEIRTQYDEKFAGKDELLRQQELKVSELESALATSQSTNKDLISRMKEQEEVCSKKILTAQTSIQELERAQAASNASLTSANHQIGQFKCQVQACQKDIQARDSQIERHRQELATEAAALSTAGSKYDSISQSLNSVTKERDQAQGRLAGLEEDAGKLRVQNGELQSQLSDLERRSQANENDWAEARKYVGGLEEERESLRKERNSLQSRVQELTVLSPGTGTDQPEQQQQAGIGPSKLASDQESATEQSEDEESDLGHTAAHGRRARRPASALADSKRNRIGKKKAAKATKVVNAKAVKAKDMEVMEEFEEGDFIYSKKTVEAPPEWHPGHPSFDWNKVNVDHEDFNPQAFRYATEVQFQLQQENNQKADDSVEATKTANESLVDRINTLNW